MAIICYLFCGIIKMVMRMQKFNEISYIRPNYNDIKEQLTELIKKIETTNEYNQYLIIFKQIIKIQNNIEEMHDYADIRNMRDSSNEFYNKEIIFWNEYKYQFDLLFKPFYLHCINTKFKEQLKEIVPENFFNTIEFQLKINSDDLVELQKKENELKMQYRKIINEKIIFEGKERNLSYVSGYFSNQDRLKRKEAHDAVNDFYYQKQNELDEIFLKMIKIRNEIANKLGFDNYATYSIYKLRRFDYDYIDIFNFRNNIIKYIIPLHKKMNEWKKQELEIEEVEYYDTIYFKKMPKLLYYGNDLLTEFQQSLKKINKKLYIFYQEMLKNEYIDLETRNNKINFAITNYLTETNVPVITGNFKNSYQDLQTLTHEFGHAYQKYNSAIEDKKYIVSALLKYPTFDIAEMFSYAMEIICMPYTDNLFTEANYKKYCFMKIYNMINAIPYICLIDEFQEKIYSIENISKNEIRSIWLELSKKYCFEKNNEGHINLDAGGYFYRQNHIFQNPFYYIDYALSYFGAFSISNECTSNLKLFEEIGSVASYYPLKKLINKYNLPNPFNENSIKTITRILENKLNEYRITDNN